MRAFFRSAGRWPAFIFFIALSLCLSLIAGCGKEEDIDVSIYREGEGPVKSQEDIPLYREGEILVKFKKGVGEVKKTMLHKAIGATVSTHTGLIEFERVRLPAGLSVEEGIRLYRKEEDVEYAEPNYIVRKGSIPDDPYFSLQWGLHNSEDADIDAPEAWDIHTGNRDVVIAVIDTGVDYTHPDLLNNIWRNPGEVADNGIDDDGNGKIDDTKGWNFVSDNNDPMDDDVDGHGTHVAGIIGVLGDNGIGIAGVIWSAKIMILKFLDSQGNGTIADAVAAIDYAVSMGASIINASYTYPHRCSKTDPSLIERDAILSAGERGVLFVAAAGNYHCNNDNTPFYPAGHNLPNIISVAATNEDDELTSWSNYGSNTVHVAAPGEDIYSTVPEVKGGYNYISGTSSAAPFVTGLAGLIASLHPEYGYVETKNAILASVDILPSLTGRIITNGRINAYRALSYTGWPVAPSGLSAMVVSGSEVDLMWQDNSSNEDGFAIERKKEGDTYSQIEILEANTTSYNDTRVDDGTIYYYRIRSYNANGYSNYSNEVKTNTPLNPPSGLSAEVRSSSEIHLSWIDNSSSEEWFEIERKMEGEEVYNLIGTVGSDVIKYSDRSLEAGKTYYYRVRGVNNDVGPSAYSNEVMATTTATESEGSLDDKDCFIATAAYGSPLHPRVQVLRNLRDRYLITNSAGRAFVRFYYRVSPPIARFISRHEYLRGAVRLALIPVVSVSEFVMGDTKQK